MNISKQTECRICHGELRDVLDLGIIYRSSFVKEDEVNHEDEKAPLVLSKCTDCGLTQLRDTIDLDVMYKEQYWYSSALNKSMISSLKDVVNDIESKIELQDDDTVLDIGCNDGTLLQLYSKDVFKVGFDPAPNLNKPECFFINDYFTAIDYEIAVKTRNLKPKVITAIAMFYDLPDPNRFVQDVKIILHEKGIFIIQFTDLLSMFKLTAFDNICHEHLEYYRLYDVLRLLRKHGMDVVDVSYNDVNGGSIRITACHDGAYIPRPSVVSCLTKEREYLNTYGFTNFSVAIEKVKNTVTTWLKLDKDNKNKVLLLGASTKGNTLLQVCEITNEQIPYAAEVNKDKFGLKTLGSNIKIVSEEEAFAMKPDYFFCPVWHFEKNLLTKKPIIDYIEQGGKLVFPLPTFHIVGKEELNDGR